MTRRGRIATAAVTTMLAGCAEGLQFRQDERLRFLEPRDRSVASGPVRLRWTLSPRQRPRPVYGVFVDAAPMAPGEGVAALAEDDPYCRPQVSCPDRRWLAGRGVHLTRGTSLRIPRLPPGGGEDLGDVERHEVTIVLLDRHGVRLGEAAWTLTLFTGEDG